MIAVDWGTSQLRAYRLDAEGRAVESRSRPEGILAVPPGGFPNALDAIVQGWESDAGDVLMSGMVGSRNGWREIPYVECPADIGAIARGLGEVAWRSGRRARICPGISCRDADGVPDVIRGEEVQVFGALALRPARASGSFLMAGTHAKHVRARDGAILGFATFMTGEIFAVLREHSILGRTMEADRDFDAAAFADGVARSGQGGGVLHHLFGVRTRALFDARAAAGNADYLSGLLIGHTVRAAGLEPPVTVIGAPVLADRYRAACLQLGCAAETVTSEEATLAGLLAVRRNLGV